MRNYAPRVVTAAGTSANRSATKKCLCIDISSDLLHNIANMHNMLSITTYGSSSKCEKLLLKQFAPLFFERYLIFIRFTLLLLPLHRKLSPCQQCLTTLHPHHRFSLYLLPLLPLDVLLVLNK